MSTPTAAASSASAVPDLFEVSTEIARHAETAFVAAALLSRRMLDETRWLDPNCFLFNHERVIYEALQDIAETEPPGDQEDSQGQQFYETARPGAWPTRPQDGRVEAAVRRSQALHQEVLRRVNRPEVLDANWIRPIDEAYLESLIHSCPNPRHGVHYARLVARQAGRRAQESALLVLDQQAQTLDLSDPDAAQHLTDLDERARRILAGLAAYQGLDPDTLVTSDRPADPDEPPGPLGPMEALQATLAGELEPMTEAMARETELLADIAAYPEKLDEPEVQALAPAHFTSAATGALFAAARLLRERDEPLDAVLLVAEADTVRPWTDDFGPHQARRALRALGRTAPGLAEEILVHARHGDVLETIGQLQRQAAGTPSHGTAAAPATSVPPAADHAAGAALAPAQEPGGLPAARHRPVVVVVAGPDDTASEGVSVLIRDVLARRPGTGAPVTLDGHYPPDHPLYGAVVASGATTAAERYAAAEQQSINQRSDVILRAKGSDPQSLTEAMRRYRDAGFRVEVAAVPVSEPQQRLNALDAHLRTEGVAGAPARQPDHLAAILRTVEDQGLADTVSVMRPNGQALYTNQVTAGPDGTRNPRRASHAAEAAEAEVRRSWSVEESVRHAAQHARVLAQSGPDAEQELQTISAQAASHHGPGAWAQIAETAGSSIAAAPEPGSRPGERVRAAGDVADLTGSQLDQALTQAVRNHHLKAAIAHRRMREAADAQARATADSESALDRLKASGAGEEAIQRARTALAEDASYAAEQARKATQQAEALRVRAGQILREYNRRSQLTPQQLAGEDKLRQHRAQERWESRVAIIHQKGVATRPAHQYKAKAPAAAPPPRRSGRRGTARV